MPGTPLNLDDPRLKRFYDYWRSKHRAALLPGRADIDPLDIPDLLPHISMLDVVREDGALRFRFRLVGTANVQIAGREHTGAFIEDVFEPADVAQLQTIYRTIVETREPHFWQIRLGTMGNPAAHYARLMVPLATDGLTVDLLMGLFVVT
jgi:hypothetical protein